MGGPGRRTEPQRATGSLGGGAADGRDPVPRLPHGGDLSWGCRDEYRHPGRPGGVGPRVLPAVMADADTSSARAIVATIRSSVTGSPASGERIGIVAASASLRHPT